MLNTVPVTVHCPVPGCGETWLFWQKESVLPKPTASTPQRYIQEVVTETKRKNKVKRTSFVGYSMYVNDEEGWRMDDKVLMSITKPGEA